MEETRLECLTRRSIKCPSGLFIGEVWELLRLQRAEIERAREAFSPVQDWYDVEEGGRDFSEMLTDAIADLQLDRKKALESRKLKAEIEWLQAIVDKLLTTADGVPVLPGMNLWAVDLDGGVYQWLVEVVSTDGRLRGVFHHVSNECDASRCYSTREAAEEAKEE